MSLVPRGVVWLEVSNHATSLLSTMTAWSLSLTGSPDAYHTHQEVGREDAIDMKVTDFPP